MLISHVLRIMCARLNTHHVREPSASCRELWLASSWTVMKTELTWSREGSKSHSQPDSRQLHTTWHFFKSELVYFNRRTRNNHTVTMPLSHTCLPGESCLNLVANLVVRSVCFLRSREEGLEPQWWGWGTGGCRRRNHDWNIQYSITFFYKSKLRLPLESSFIPSRNSYPVLGLVTLTQVLSWSRLCGSQCWGETPHTYSLTTALVLHCSRSWVTLLSQQGLLARCFLGPLYRIE